MEDDVEGMVHTITKAVGAVAKVPRMGKHCQKGKGPSSASKPPWGEVASGTCHGANDSDNAAVVKCLRLTEPEGEHCDAVAKVE